MKRITSFEIRCLKELLKIYRARIFQREQQIINLELENEELLKIYRARIFQREQQIINLELENEELRKQLEESRAKEGKGALEKMIDGIADAVAGIGKMFSTMSSDELKALVEANDDEEEDDHDG